MDINELKPNLEKIASIQMVTTIGADNSKEKYKSLLGFVEKNWNGIINGEISYEIKDNARLKNLIEEYSLEKNYNDLIFLAHRFIRQKNLVGDSLTKHMELYQGKGRDLLYALEIFYGNEIKDIRITIKHKTKKISSFINNRILLNLIREALHKEYIDHDLYFKQGFTKPENIEDWGKYFKFIILEEEAKGIKKGRKKKQRSGLYIDILQVYLQLETDINADPGITISRKQASFIFKFLSILELISDELVWEEDNIRHILTKYREERSSIDLFDYHLAMKEYATYTKSMKAKIKNINKKK